MHDVTEEDGKGADGQPDADAEHHKEKQADGKPDEMPCGNDAEEHHDDGNGNEREGVVHEREEHLLHREDEAVDLDFLKQGRRLDNRGKRVAGGIAHEGERDVAQNEVQRIVLDVVGEEKREHDAHDHHHEQRVQDAPCHTEEAPTVLNLEILGDKLPKDVKVLSEVIWSIRRYSSVRPIRHAESPCLIAIGTRSIVRCD